MANVEEELGDGMYALRWAGNRVTVFSQASLAAGQSLILKSELSADGKPTLVVQGPALPRFMAAADMPSYGPAGGQPATRDAIAAGVASAVLSQPTPSGTTDLIGRILQPLPDFPESAEKLLRDAREELLRLNNSSPADSGTSGAGRPAEQPSAEADRSMHADAGAAGSEISRQPEPHPHPGDAIREALAQIIKAAELPLSRLATPPSGGKIPESALEKAADILLRAVGLTPDIVSRDAAKALIRHNVQVDRANVQSLIAIAAGTPEIDRPGRMNAGARLLARDVPLIRPLAAGLADILSRRIGTRELADRAVAALDWEPQTPEAKPLVHTARDLIRAMNVDIDSADLPSTLERYVSTSGRETLGKALALLEKAAQAVLESHPELARLDKAINIILAQSAKGTPAVLESQPIPNDDPAASAPDSQGPGQNKPQSEAGRPAASGDDPPSPGLSSPESSYPTPGGNRPEVDLLRPAGPLSLFLSKEGDVKSAVPERVTREAETVMRDLLSDDPAKVETAGRELKRRNHHVLQEAARTLNQMESKLLRNDSQLARLAEGAGILRELGRQTLAIKAENLAGREREPGMLLAEIPFRLAEDQGEGRMQMFYRKIRTDNKGWTSRIILDLTTTGFGPVLGDMRFFGKDMILNLFVGKSEMAEFLDESGGDLIQALLEKGFRLTPHFLVLPPPKIQQAGHPEVRESPPAEPPIIQSRPVPRQRGRLDVRG
jgi:hypothetical protein